MAYAIDVVGLGAGDLDQIPLGIYKKLRQTATDVFVRTADHPAVSELQSEGITFQSFDHIYEETDQFADVYQRMADTLLEAAQQRPLVYAVPGHPMLAEKTVQLLLEHNDANVNVIGGDSYLDALFAALAIDPIDGMQIVDALDFERQQLNYRHHMIFAQIYDQLTAANVKLTLLTDLPHDYPVTIVIAAGSSAETIIETPLDELDRAFSGVYNLASVYIPPAPDSLLHHTFTRLRDVIDALRGPDGCPWNRAQTHESLREYAVEEVYELTEAIDKQDDDGMVEELGDLLLQVMLHSRIGEEAGYFSVDDVICSITDKMIRRHPHVFSDQTADTVNDVEKTWETVKQEEKGYERQSVLDGIPASMAGLSKAYKLQEKAAKVGFGWDSSAGICHKFREELNELQVAMQQETHPAVELELGDVLFVLANLARHLDIHPELALNQTNAKFVSRFSYMEQTLSAQGKTLSDTSQEEMERYWNQAKKSE